jgi:DNA-directed RNA polymerase specialized sigma24 family protein
MTPDMGAIALLKKLVAHAYTLSQSRRVAQEIVYGVLPRFPRGTSGPDTSKLDGLLAEIGDLASKVSVMQPDDPRDEMDAAVSRLPVEEREALSLHSNFELGMNRIAAITFSTENVVSQRVARALAAVGETVGHRQ